MAQKVFESHANMRIPTKNPFKITQSIFKSSVLLSTKKAAWDVAQEYADYAQKVIYEQLWRWPELSESYLKFKERVGLDLRMLIATGGFVEKIGVYPDEEGNPRIGFPDDDSIEGSEISLRLLARFLEFGTRYMKARQLWRPLQSIAVRRMKQTARQLQEKAERTARRELARQIRMKRVT